MDVRNSLGGISNGVKGYTTDKYLSKSKK